MGENVNEERFDCRSCGSSDGRLVLDLGTQPLANNLLAPEDLGKPEPLFPLRVFVCPGCWLLQITDVVPPVQLFSEYLYFSSFSDAMLHHAEEAVRSYIEKFSIGPEDLVVEIASNDGYLLQYVKAAGIPSVGIEPAGNIAEVARAKGIETIVEFFGEATGQRLADSGRAATLALGNNVFAHVPDINDFVAGIAALLRPTGRAVLEFPYGVDLVDRREFDTIYHEHVFYFSLTPLDPLFKRHGLEIVDVDRIPIHGGSLRLTAARRGAFPASAAVGDLLDEEKEIGVGTLSYYEDFSSQVLAIRRDLRDMVKGLKTRGFDIAAYGASAKGSTMLNFCGIDGELIDFVADRNTYKHGLLTPGMHLPIVPAETLLERMPEYTLLLTWNFVDEILEQQRPYTDAGGRFVVPIPDVRVAAHNHA